MVALKSINLGVRFLLELCMLAAVGYWGFKTSSGWLLKTLPGIGTPLLIAVIWGSFVAPKAAYPLHSFILACTGSGPLWLGRGGVVYNEEQCSRLGLCGDCDYQ
jgi:hypothetical protein